MNNNIKRDVISNIIIILLYMHAYNTIQFSLSPLHKACCTVIYNML